jgi:hypothetical protein
MRDNTWISGAKIHGFLTPFWPIPQSRTACTTLHSTHLHLVTCHITVQYAAMHSCITPLCNMLPSIHASHHCATCCIRARATSLYNMLLNNSNNHSNTTRCKLTGRMAAGQLAPQLQLTPHNRGHCCSKRAVPPSSSPTSQAPYITPHPPPKSCHPGDPCQQKLLSQESR